MYKFTAAVILIFSGMSLSTASAADWSSDLQGGGTVSVDPDTRRATITRDGVTSPLWNGVHRLQDGSAMIINNGEVVTGDRGRYAAPVATTRAFRLGRHADSRILAL